MVYNVDASILGGVKLIAISTGMKLNAHKATYRVCARSY